MKENWRKNKKMNGSSTFSELYLYFAWTEQKRQLHKHNNLKRDEKNRGEEGAPFWGLM